MYKIFFGLFLLFASVVSATAADFPRAELFGGYQYTHLEGGLNCSGFNFALNGNFNDFFGITVDLGAAYKGGNEADFRNYTYTFGPVLSLRANKRYTPFVHALIGGDHASVGTNMGGTSSNGFALMAGGGVDFKIDRRFAFRAAQADWFLVHGSGVTSSKNFRISTGIVVGF